MTIAEMVVLIRNMRKSNKKLVTSILGFFCRQHFDELSTPCTRTRRIGLSGFARSDVTPSLLSLCLSATTECCATKKRWRARLQPRTPAHVRDR